MKAADTGDGAFKIEVTGHISSQCLFRLRSHRSYEHEGDKIYYDDELLVYHDSADCYMNFSEKSEPVALDRVYNGMIQAQPDTEEYNYISKRPSIKRPVDIRISIINENKSKCLWKFIQHCSYENFEKKNKIKSHDIVYFIHTKNKGMIASSLSTQEFYLKESLSNQELLSNDCFWELIPQEVNEVGPENCDLFMARNIITGQFLEHHGFVVQIKAKDPVEEGGFINQGLVNLLCNQDEYKLERGQQIPLNEQLAKIVQQSQSQYRRLRLLQVKQLKQDSFCIVKVDEQTMMNIQYIVSAHQPIVKFNNIVSSENLLRKIQNYDFKRMFMNLIPEEDMLANLIHIFKLLAGKIYNTTYENIGPSGNTPNQIIQKILVETGITELLIEILFLLYEPFKDIQKTNEPSEDRAIRNKISEIFECTYKLLKKIAVGNENNRIYLSRWVDLFLQHSNNINRAYIQECLVCILQNNPVSIEATINEQKINELIESFFSEAKRETFLTTKYLSLFSTFIKCEDRVIKQNQQIILNKFFKSQKNQWSLKFKLEEKDEEQIHNPLKLSTNHPIYDKILKYRVQIALGKQDFSSIPKFFKDWASKWNYFLVYVNLLADICMDRNCQSISNVQALISLQFVAVILNDPEIMALNQKIYKDNQLALQKIGVVLYPITNVHEPFVRIAHHIYINNEKFVPIKLIKSISSWYHNQSQQKQILSEQTINKTKRKFEGQKQQEQKTYLMNILSYIERFIENCDQDNNNLNILLTILKLLKQTVILGLWESIDQFRKLIPLLIMRINKIQNVKLFDADEQTKQRFGPKDIVKKNIEKLKLDRPELTLNIQCKIIATQIFKLINQLEIDIRLRYMMKFFKGLYQATQSFEDYNKVFQDQTLIDQKNALKRNLTAREEFLKNQSASILGDVKKISEDQDIMLKESIWYNKVKQLTPFELDSKGLSDPGKNRYLFQGQKGSQIKYNFDDMVLAMFELPVFQNHKLLNSSLIMLREMFEQRKQMIDKFKQILICGKGNLLEVYLTLKYMREKFKILSNMNIKKYKDFVDPSFNYAFYKAYDSGIKQHSKRSGILQDLFFLARTLKYDINLKNIESLMHVDKGIFETTCAYDHLNQKQKSNILFQRVNLAEGIYVPLINYIQLIGTNFTENHRYVLFGIYNYLSLLCFNNLEAKQVLMQYIPDILPHLSKKVGASNFLYEVCINNKLLVNNQEIVSQIIDGALQACVDIDREDQVVDLIRQIISKGTIKHQDYEKSQIFHSLRGILLYNDEGHKKNQQLLINRLQDSKYKRLIFKGKCEFISKKQNFHLTFEEAYIANHFQLFAGLVESQNFINIGKLENIHPYPYCLECLKTTNKLQLRRSIRAYINRLYYVNKDRDIFLFEQFIRKEFKIINEELSDLVYLHKNKLITDETIIPNGIRFKYALSEIFQMILEILITLHEMLLKPEFLKILDKQIGKQQKKQQNQRQIHDQFVKLLINLGCLNKIYPKTKTVAPFIKQVYKHIAKVMMKFQHTYLKKKASDVSEIAIEQTDDLGVDMQKKSYIYDHSKSFFRNLNNMIRDIKTREARLELIQRREIIKDSGQLKLDVTQVKKNAIQQIYNVQGENLKPFTSKKDKRSVFSSQYKPHIQTANSKIFKVVAKPLLGQNQENNELNKKLSQVKVIIQNSPSFRKLREDEFYNLVKKMTEIDKTSSIFYSKQWKNLQMNKSSPVIPLKQILKNSFNLIMNYSQQINDSEKIFVIKLSRCYITEAIEEKQAYKLSVDKWCPDYYGGVAEQFNDNQQSLESQLVKRQNLIQECGGSDLIISLLSQNLTSRAQLLNEVLLLGIAYLFNGNTHCQDSLLTSLKNDPSNLMLIGIRNLIKIIGNFLIQIRKIKQSGKQRQFAYKIEDTYDYFDSNENTLVKQFGYKSVDKFQMLAEINYEKALCRIFRFLQLFCENNNVNMKKFLLKQVNEDEGKKNNSINFIEEATLLLRKLFKIMNYKIVVIPPCILDFINEITQIPCLQNQQSFMKSTFFEDISYMADFFQDYKNILNRKFNPLPQEEQDSFNVLKAIYQKGIELALVNFEGNDNDVFWEFLTKCQPKFMWICIKQNLVLLLKENADKWGIVRDDFEVIEENESYQPSQMVFTRKLFSEFSPARIEELISSEKANGAQFKEQIIKILKVFYIIKKLQDYGHVRNIIAIKDKQNPNSDEREKANKALNYRLQIIKEGRKQFNQIQKFIQLFQNLILSIQVSSHNGNQINNQFIYFPNQPVFEYLAGDTHNDIMIRVKRQTQRDKQISLISMKEQVKEQIYLNYELKYNKISYRLPLIGKQFQKQLPITSEFMNQVRGYARKCSFFICFLLIIFILVDHDRQEQFSVFTYSNMFTQVVIEIVCKLQLLLTLGFLYIWVCLRKPLALKKYQNQNQQKKNLVVVSQSDNSQCLKKSAQLEQGWQSLSKFLILILSGIGSKLSTILSYLVQHPIYKNIITTFIALYKYESGFLSILIFVIASFAGNFIGVEWYVIHIFDIFTDISELTNIFKAILDNIQKLTILSILAGMFILVFNVLSLSTYSHVIYEDDIPEQACEQIVDCVLVLYTSGAIGDDMDQFQMGRFLFDIGYVVFMQMMFQQIVGGIVLDALAGLKEQDSFRDQDKQNICYICGMNKVDMEKNAETFERHTQKHFLWNYLYYILCLEKKDPTDFSGLEFEIDDKIKSEDVTWFPVISSDSGEGNAEQVMKQLEQSIKQMSGYSNALYQKSMQIINNANLISTKMIYG